MYGIKLQLAVTYLVPAVSYGPVTLSRRNLTVGWEAIHHRIRDLRGTNYARRFVFFISPFHQIQE